jgi:hypothetical protein
MLNLGRNALMTDRLRVCIFSVYGEVRGRALMRVKGLSGDFASLASYRV